MNATEAETLREVLSLPTVPFREECVIGWLRTFAVRHKLLCRQDRDGNVLLTYRRGHDAPRSPWVLAAHMDHPGFVATRDSRTHVRAEFRGGLARSYFQGSRVEFHAPGGSVSGVVEHVTRCRATGWLQVRVARDTPAGRPVPPGTPGMWRLPPWRLRGRVVSARACDDLAGVAAVCATLSRLASRGVSAHATALLTRAEEVGFAGAMAACRNRVIPRQSPVISIETSLARPDAPLGGGVVVRVGDRTRSFDPAVTARLAEVADALSRRRRGFAWSRRLMPGGTCEATAYGALGYRAGAVCLPLGNYHNGGPKNRVAPERIHLDDYANLVELLTALCQVAPDLALPDRRLRVRLQERLARLEPYF